MSVIHLWSPCCRAAMQDCHAGVERSSLALIDLEEHDPAMRVKRLLWCDFCCRSSKQPCPSTHNMHPRFGLHHNLFFLNLLYKFRPQMRLAHFQVASAALRHQYVSGPNLCRHRTLWQAQIKRKELHGDAYFLLIRANVYHRLHSALPPHCGSQGGQGRSKLLHHHHLTAPLLQKISGKRTGGCSLSFFSAFILATPTETQLMFMKQTGFMQ